MGSGHETKSLPTCDPCLDASVMRGTECHTDHHLLRVKLKMHKDNFNRKLRQRGRKFNVSHLCIGKESDIKNAIRKTFEEEVNNRVSSQDKDKSYTVEEKQGSHS